VSEAFGDPTTAPFWEGARRNRLLIQRCRSCGRHQFYPRPFCIRCNAGQMDWVEAKGTGAVYSMSTVHVPPSPDFEAPYVVAIVELDEGPKLMTNIVNGVCGIGDPVRVVWRARDGTPPLPMFEPAGSP
jgi:uncharacterized OB-fold protein